MTRPDGWIETHTGRKVWPLSPRPQDISILDIAHALSNICRFTGHVSEFYSVAQHSVTVSYMAPPGLELWGLLHDASEAYICDVSRPVKHMPAMRPYRNAEYTLQRCIARRFGLTPLDCPPEIKAIDRRMVLTEGRDLGFTIKDWGFTEKPYRNLRIIGQSPFSARVSFLARFLELSGRSDKS